jgi:ubiquinone/menaquinone biosynthesis C-methylase UbiE
VCTWARDHQVTGTGVDVSTVFIAAARARAVELAVADRVSFVHGDACGYVADAPD